MEISSGCHRRWLTLAAAVAVVAGCVGPASPPVIKIRAGYFTTQDFLPYFVMQDQGFDRAQGLQLEMTTFAGGAGVISAMVAGSIDLGGAIGSVPLLSAAERGLVPDTIVVVAANNMADEDHRAVAVVAAPSVQSWRDLTGRRIAVNARDSVAAAAVVGRLRLEGIADYTLVEIPFANMGLAVAGGNVAAAGMAEPFVTQSLLRGDGGLLGWVMGGGPPFTRAPFTVIVVSSDFHRKRPEGVKAYLRAHLQAVRWINANVEPARVLLARRLDLTREVGARLNLLRYPGDARDDPASLDAMQSLLVETRFLKTPIPARRLYDETLLEQVLAERGQARR